MREQTARDRAMMLEARRYADEQRRAERPSNGAAAEPRVPQGTQSGVSFGQFVEALGARPSGEGFTALCPAHDDRRPSLSIKQAQNGKTLIFCHAGCDSRTRLIPLLVERGLWPVEAGPDRQPEHRVEHRPRPDPAALPPFLFEFGSKLIHPENRKTERYLKARGIEVSELREILHHPRAYHQPTGRWWPCMVAAVRSVDGHLRSVHRTFLSHTEPPTKAMLGGVVIDRVRMTWFGIPVRGCAIWLSPPAPTLVVAEGIETTASAMKRYGLPGWSGLSADNIGRHLELPDLVREVVLAADNEPKGIAAANAAANRFRREGRAVRIVKPKHVKDFNDLLLLKRERYGG
jgi:hypothetical protein